MFPNKQIAIGFGISLNINLFFHVGKWPNILSWKYKFQTHFSFRTQINFVIVLIIKYTRSESLKNLSTT